tara:strand:+ start:644 stop:1684 length:1041 start_codon:yes stop_codon:yes gene_type:complete
MILNLLFFLIAIIYLLILNKIQLNTRFCLDQISRGEKHKLFARIKNEVPLSGSFFLLPLICYLFFLENNSLYLICVLFFGLGLMSDLKILSSPKNRFLLQIIFLLIYISVEENLKIDLRIQSLNSLMSNDFFRIIMISFFLLVLVNGFNFIDGVNNLCSLNFLIILFFLNILGNKFPNFGFQNQIELFIIFLSVFVIFNFFGKNFLGDGAVYGVGLLIGVLSMNLSSISNEISPYFIANLLWFPAFENLFSIIRRLINKKKNYLADNLHLHQLLFKYFLRNKLIKKKLLLSSFTGLSINVFLLSTYTIGFLFYSKTNVQIILIFLSILTYITLYIFLLKKTRLVCK